MAHGHLNGHLMTRWIAQPRKILEGLPLNVRSTSAHPDITHPQVVAFATRNGGGKSRRQVKL
jgi:hypothetical protein